VQQEGYDAHDFNLFDDRSSVLWRKPYVDGAVRELTSGDTRSQEKMRQMVERMMSRRELRTPMSVTLPAVRIGHGPTWSSMWREDN
jgi:hypothetical protein